MPPTTKENENLENLMKIERTDECPRMKVRTFFGNILKWNEKSGTFWNESPNDISIQNTSIPMFHFKMFPRKCELFAGIYTNI